MQFILLLLINLSIAHDIGISTVQFVELENYQYSLSVETTESKLNLFKTPTLPNHCKFIDNPRGEFINFNKVYKWKCQRPLNANDTLTLDWKRDGLYINILWLSGDKKSLLIKKDSPKYQIKLSTLLAPSGSFIEIAKRYVFLGLEHILIGIDHLLFVLGLMMLVSNRITLIKTITSFTIAHSITLFLSTMEIFNLPSRPVEAIIALSILLLTIEILNKEKGQSSISIKYPWAISFIFGLIHGLGFAGALSEIGIAQSEILPALLFFNIGVELGQILFVIVIIAIGIVGRNTIKTIPSFLKKVPTYILGTLSSYWVLSRLFF